MRERLIELLRYGKKIIPINDDRTRLSVIADIAAYLSDNGVIVPPCKVGDTVYFVARNSGRPIGTIDEIEIVQIARRKEGFHAKGRFKGSLNEFEIRSFKIDNYSFFLTKEEAEAALKGGAD